MARASLQLLLGLVLVSVVRWTQAKQGQVLALRRRDGGLIARGLLRNATLPLHGAVKDYGYALPSVALPSLRMTSCILRPHPSFYGQQQHGQSVSLLPELAGWL